MSENRNQPIPSAPLFQGAQAEARARQRLGIPTLAIVQQAVILGAGAARSTTLDHPASYRGQRMWAEMVAGLRSGLRPHGWGRQVHKGVELVSNPAKGVALLVTAADANAGKPTKVSPQVRYDRKELTSWLIQQGAPDLFGGTGVDYEVWLVLHYLHEDPARGVGAEISLPVGCTGRGYVSGWHERILIDDPFTRPSGGLTVPSPQVSPAPSTPAVPTPSAGAPVIDVPIRRRTA